ncbi:unnamed protein product [Musa acuminata subsp. burmannicoides]
MEPVDLVPRGYRGTPFTVHAVAFADVYRTEPWNLLGSDRQERYLFTDGSRVDRHRFLDSSTTTGRRTPGGRCTNMRCVLPAYLTFVLMVVYKDSTVLMVVPSEMA